MKISDIEVKLIDYCGTDLSVVNAARVSMDKESNWEVVEVENQEALEKLISEGWEDHTDYEHGWKLYAKRLKSSDVKLIKYLADHKHFSPFNHSFLSFRVKIPIFVARQLVKHKFMPWNETSRRYVDSEPEFYIPQEFRERAENVKQGSKEGPMDGSDMVRTAVIEHCKSCLLIYNRLLHTGVCPEQARIVLPQQTMTELYWSGTLGACLDMLNLRLDPHTQYETRNVADLIAKDVRTLFPVSYEKRIGAK